MADVCSPWWWYTGSCVYAKPYFSLLSLVKTILSLFFFFVVSIIKIRPARFIQQTYTRNVKCAFPNYVLAICSCLPSCHHPVWCVLSGWKSLTQSATLKPQDSKPSDWRAVRELTGTGFDRSHMHINLDGKTCTFLWLTVQARSGDDRGGPRALLGCLGSLLPYFGNDFLIFHWGITPSPLATHMLCVNSGLGHRNTALSWLQWLVQIWPCDLTQWIESQVLYFCGNLGGREDLHSLWGLNLGHRAVPASFRLALECSWH